MSSESRTYARSMPPPMSRRRFQSTSARRPDDALYIDRWTPLTDHSHQHRVELWRKRKGTALNLRRGAGSPHEAPVARSAGTQEVRPLFSRSPSELSQASFDTSQLSTDTDILPSSLSSSDLASTFQDELDSYDEQITTLRHDEWPAPPNPRAAAVRVDGSEFSRQIAKNMKSWSFAQGLLYGEQSAALRNTDRIHEPESYVPGVIFSAPFHSSSNDERWVSVTDPHNTATPFGIVHSKYRKMIVIKIFGEHCVCLPIYSHHGQGLEGKQFHIEYVSIRDVSDSDPEPAEGPHHRLLAVANAEFCGRIVAGKSNVKLTEFCSHRFNTPATMEGKLDNKSVSMQRLLELVKMTSDTTKAMKTHTAVKHRLPSDPTRPCEDQGQIEVAQKLFESQLESSEEEQDYFSAISHASYFPSTTESRFPGVKDFLEELNDLEAARPEESKQKITIPGDKAGIWDQPTLTVPKGQFEDWIDEVGALEASDTMPEGTRYYKVKEPK
ncbi:hypothetical protein F5Y19DRAFT_488259 [Xylariaceae sp. FL1651]|nr:hypothetical protein F5Y19DRAFT_488259 [Xylariaceae sp. FL1651]